MPRSGSRAFNRANPDALEFEETAGENPYPSAQPLNRGPSENPDLTLLGDYRRRGAQRRPCAMSTFYTNAPDGPLRNEFRAASLFLVRCAPAYRRKPEIGLACLYSSSTAA